jgi:hypothetical protein
MIKLLLILHLCLAFTLFLADLSDPFLASHYRTRENQIRLLNLKGDTSLFTTATPAESEQLIANRDLWAALPESEKLFFENTETSTETKTQRIPSFLLTSWAVASVVVCILMLKGRASGTTYFYMVPLLSLLLVLDTPIGPDPFRIPSESVLENKYLKSPIQGTINDQMSLLKQAFQIYLVQEWGKETPLSDPEAFKKQLHKGMFAYNKAQLEYRMTKGAAERGQKVGPLGLMLFVLWNGLLFFIVKGSRWRSRRNILRLQEG